MRMEENKTQEPRWISGIEPSKELLAASGTEILEIECREQPARLHDLIRDYSGDPDVRAQLEVMRNLAAKKAGPVLFIGMGASFCSSISGSILLQSSGRP